MGQPVCHMSSKADVCQCGWCCWGPGTDTKKPWDP